MKEESKYTECIAIILAQEYILQGQYYQQVHSWIYGNQHQMQNSKTLNKCNQRSLCNIRNEYTDALEEK